MRVSAPGDSHRAKHYNSSVAMHNRSSANTRCAVVGAPSPRLATRSVSLIAFRLPLLPETATRVSRSYRTLYCTVPLYPTGGGVTSCESQCSAPTLLLPVPLVSYSAANGA